MAKQRRRSSNAKTRLLKGLISAISAVAVAVVTGGSEGATSHYLDARDKPRQVPTSMSHSREASNNFKKQVPSAGPPSYDFRVDVHTTTEDFSVTINAPEHQMMPLPKPHSTLLDTTGKDSIRLSYSREGNETLQFSVNRHLIVQMVDKRLGSKTNIDFSHLDSLTEIHVTREPNSPANNE